MCYASRQRSMTEFSDEEKVMGVKLVVKLRYVPINAIMKIEKKDSDEIRRKEQSF